MIGERLYGHGQMMIDKRRHKHGHMVIGDRSTVIQQLIHMNIRLQRHGLERLKLGNLIILG